MSSAARAAVAGTLLLAVGCAPDEGEAFRDLVGWNDSAADRERAIAEAYGRAEDLVAACMAEQGFEYVPETLDFVDRVHLREEMGEDELRERYGYGISTIDRDLQSVDGSTASADEAANEAIRDRLDPAELAAYDRALHGDPSGDPDPEGDHPWGDGCRARSHYEVMVAQRVAADELQPLLEDLSHQIRSDPRVLAAEADWSACMAEHGYAFDDPVDARFSIEQRWAALEEAAAPDWSAVDPEDPAEPVWGSLDPDELARLQDDERTLAAVDHECAVQHLGPADEARAELEGSFAQQHRDLLERVRDER